LIDHHERRDDWGEKLEKILTFNEEKVKEACG